MVRKSVFSWDVQRATYMHEFSQTPNYVVTMEWPLFWDMMGIAFPLFADSSKINLVWRPEIGTKITVIDLNTQQIVRTWTVDAYWAYHHINAYEDGKGNVIVDVPSFDDNTHMKAFQLATLRKNEWKIPVGTGRRFILPVETGETPTVTTITERGFDLPVMNMRHKGEKYQFLYAVQVSSQN
jgi:carotenoid cleavage dioxygenase-like enzyme